MVAIGGVGMGGRARPRSGSDRPEPPAGPKGPNAPRAPSAKPHAGGVELGEGAGLLAHHVVHLLLDQGAAEVAAAVGGSLGRGDRVLIVPERSLAASEWSYRLIKMRLDAFDDALDALGLPLDEMLEAVLEPREQGFGPSGANFDPSALIGDAVDVAGWFRSDYAVKGGELEAGQAPLLAALAGHLSGSKERVEATLDAFHLLSESGLLDHYALVGSKRNFLAGTAAQASLVDFGQDGPDPGQVVKAAERLVTDFDTFAAQITATPGEGNGFSPLLVAALHERLHDRSSRFTHVLYCGLDSARGESIPQSRLWGEPTVRHIGAVQISYLLLYVKGNALKQAGTLPLLGSSGFGLRSGRAGPLRRLSL